ncbi:DUF6263 family protein [Pedobacter borealis]|uniref:DUF6263 family protein n=1 Tax=Pedobacter borealis TaxID=475254 RepID=UPI0004934DFC|nr:DUF6263 family protein [Pedobacter borealis]
MKNSKAIMTILFVCTAFSGMAQKALQLHLQVGDKWYHELKRTNSSQDMNEQGGVLELNDENILGSTYEVLAADKGTYDIKLTYNSIKFQATEPGSDDKITFDSQKQEDMDGDGGEKVKAVIGKSYVFTIDANSRKIITIKERPVKDTAQAQSPSGIEPAINFFPYNDNQLKRRVETIFGGTMPDEKPVNGTKWDKTYSEKNAGITQATTVSYTVNRIDGDKIYLDAITKMTVDGTPDGTAELGEIKVSALFNGTGTLNINKTTGIMSEAKSVIRGTQTMTTPNGRQKLSMAVSYVETVKKVGAN